MSSTYGGVAVVFVAIVTLALGVYGWRFSRTTSDFFVASRSVRPGLNASAIGGEYLSAASFLGAAGLILAFVVDDLEGEMDRLAAAGVAFTRYDGMQQDDRGVWSAPSGARIAWFLDPDGNNLSLQAVP